MNEVTKYYDIHLGIVDENKVPWNEIGMKIGLTARDAKYRWKFCLDVNKKRGLWTEEVRYNTIYIRL